MVGLEAENPCGQSLELMGGGRREHLALDSAEEDLHQVNANGID
jgi:hypothetical protein